MGHAHAGCGRWWAKNSSGRSNGEDASETPPEFPKLGGRLGARRGNISLVAGGFLFLLVGSFVGYVRRLQVAGLLRSSRRGGFRVAGWVEWRTTTGLLSSRTGCFGTRMGGWRGSDCWW